MLDDEEEIIKEGLKILTEIPSLIEKRRWGLCQTSIFKQWVESFSGMI